MSDILADEKKKVNQIKYEESVILATAPLFSPEWQAAVLDLMKRMGML